ncbi:MAG: Peptidase papain [Planctomycetaceae bacterium]|nr:Peptidase papain [Planctomycetaceae bacterium]
MLRMLPLYLALVLAFSSDLLAQGLIPTPDADYRALPKYSPTRAIEIISRKVDDREVREVVVVDGPLPPLPASVDLSSNAPDPGRQSFGDCVAWATAYCSLTTQIAQARGVEKPSMPIHIFSPRFVYSQINNGNPDGSYIYLPTNAGKSAVALFSMVGCSSELLTPYISSSADASGWSRLPDERAVKEAKNYVTFHHAACQNIDDIRYALVFGIPVVIAVQIEQAFQQFGGGVPYKWQQGVSTGNHAMCILGYDNQKQMFLVQNSWGQNWGDNGRFWVGYDEFQRLSGNDRGTGWCFEAHAIAADLSRGSQLRSTKTPAATYFFMPDGSVIRKDTNEQVAAIGEFRATEATDLYLYGLRRDGAIRGLNDQWYDISGPQFPAGLTDGRGKMIASSNNYLYTITQNGNVLGRVPRDKSTTGESFWQFVNLPDDRKPVDIRFRNGSLYVEAEDGNLYRRVPGADWVLEN